jgi:hypothetical protein
MTKREAILQAILAKLQTVSGVSTRIYRSRAQVLARAEAPAILMTFLRDTPEQISLPIIDWTMQVKVEVLTRGAVPESLADAIVKEVHTKMLEDPSLGNLAKDVQPGQVDFQLLDADGDGGVVSCDFNVLYRTLLADLTA